LAVGDQASAPNQIISLPKGGGALKGIGEKFSPDLYTGTGNFTVPIALPPGRNGFQPQPNLVYSTGNGNGLFGLGWSLSIPGVTRKTSKGIPRYRDQEPDIKNRDTFILSGAEDLVPLETPPAPPVRYRPRTEGLFARIEHHRDTNDDYWQVSSKDGLISFYGTPNLAQSDVDPAVIRKPKLSATDRDQIFSWKLTLTKDPFGNRIEYLHEQHDQSTDEDRKQGRDWQQTHLSEIRYVDYEANNQTQFLVTVKFEYEDRPDPFSDYRPGFEVRTTKRCRAILVETHADRDYKVRRYEFDYSNAALNGASHLTAINIIGFDDQGNLSQELPPVAFAYTDFNPQDQKRRDFYPIQGKDLPSSSLANPSMELVDLFGNGLPDILEMNGSVRYWRNLGNGRFDIPRSMRDAPAGFSLADAGVQLIDANGDGRTDLLITQPGLAGYFPLEFGAKWDRRSLRKYEVAPSFNLKDPEVRLVDLTGDGVTDVIRSGSRLECFFNDPLKGWHESRWVERKALEKFPNVNFSDSRVKFSDMSGDGQQDIVLVHDGNVEYWPNLGYGDWGNRIHMRNSPRFPFDYDPKRLLVGDIDGDGLADLIYVEDRKIHVWINQSGNAWSNEIIIQGTPAISDMEAVRLTDLLGSGVSGVLWTRDATLSQRDHYFFLDLTAGAKPYLLHEMNNNMGAVTRVGYAPSTKFYLDDEKDQESRWKTPLPFPVQVVAQVEVIDELSRGKLTTKYKYHHGYWDGAEREFRGFGMVEQFDTESFDSYGEVGLHGVGVLIAKVDQKYFSDPTITKTWFHQGPIGEEFGEWQEQDWSSQYWQGDPQLLKHAESVNAFLQGLGERRVKRDALRTLRGSILRTELYALDGTKHGPKPYTVTEHAYGLREEQSPVDPKSERPRIFFPHSIVQRTTQWERGNDPMTHFSFTLRYDDFGQPLSQTAIGMPRRTLERVQLSATTVADETGMLVTHTRTTYAEPKDGIYIYDRVAYTTSFTLAQKREVTESKQDDLLAVLRDQAMAAWQVHDDLESTLNSWKPEQGEPTGYNILGHTVDSYDGIAYEGEAIGSPGKHGAVTRSESLVFTDDILNNAYGILRPSYLGGSATLPAGAPVNFGTNLGYTKKMKSSGYVPGYYVRSQQKKYDFQAGGNANYRGLVVATRDALDHESTITNYSYDLLPVLLKDPLGLEIKADYNYRVLQPFRVTEPNGNFSEVEFSSMGLVTASWVKGKNGEGDQTRPSTRLEYDFLAFKDRGNPIVVHTMRRIHHDTETGMAPPELNKTIEGCEYSDGFGRLLQTRTQGEEVRFGHATFGGGEEVLPAKQSDGAGGPVSGKENASATAPNVVVSGWQIYDNKGKVVEKYEPFFSNGWSYTPPIDDQLGQKATMFYDPRGQVIRTENPDHSEQRVIYGVPINLDDPSVVTPTPWESYTYDGNDNAGRTHSAELQAYRHHQNTPPSILIDSLGRTIMTVERNRANPATPAGPLPAIEEYRARSTYDIQSNLVAVTDALGRVAFTHIYDLAKRPLKIHSIDAGDRWMIHNATGSEIERRDSKDALTLRAFDKLNRLIFVWARNASSAPALTLREQLVYGDDPASGLIPTEVAKGNLLGRLYQYCDEAGLVTFAAVDNNNNRITSAYDFKGNFLEKRRQVIADSAIVASLNSTDLANAYVVDWNYPPALEIEFQTSTAYDALNRVVSMLYPQDVDGNRKTLMPTYNRAGALETVKLDNETYVERITYNAKGQRTLIAYGNNVMTRYAYDERTFRLVRLRTEIFTQQAPFTYQPGGTRFQDLVYDYDLVGNILRITDFTPGCGVRNNPDALLFPELNVEIISGDALVRRFEYDPLYRLTSATGREAKNIPKPRPWQELAARDQNADVVSGFYVPANPPATTQSNAPDLTVRYWETYDYDPAGNMLKVAHGGNGTADWARHFGISGFTPKEWKDKVFAFVAGGSPVWGAEGNRLTNVGTNENEAVTHTFDENGNLSKEFTNRHFSWDNTDRMIAFADRATASSPASKEAAYLYDASGQRIKKLVRRQTGEIETTTYIDGVCEHHRWNKPGQPTIENNTLHVMDNQSRLAMVRVGDPFGNDGAPSVSVKYTLGDHLSSSNIVIGGTTVTGSTFINHEEYSTNGETTFGSFGRKSYRFSGKERDEESGLNYHGGRYLAPSICRWVSCDPIRRDSLNLYRYVFNRPMNHTDPSGLAEVTSAGSQPRPKVSQTDVNQTKLSFVKGAAVALAEERLNAATDFIMSPLGPLGGTPGALMRIAKDLNPELKDPTVKLGDYDRNDHHADTWNPLESAANRGYVADSLSGQAIGQLVAGDTDKARQTAGNAGYQYGRMMVNSVKLGEFAAAGAGMAAAVAKVAQAERTFIVYVFKEGKNWMYVGRASGKGSPLAVLWGRISKGHNIAKANPHLEPEIVDIQYTRAANKAAEAVFHARGTEMAEGAGYTLLNDVKVPPISNLPDKFNKGYAALVEFLIPKLKW
jgi:RHS repeat-associated protein